MKFVLASSSPRRQEMIKALGINYSICSPDIDESEKKGERPHNYVQRLAREKALNVANKMATESYEDFAILSADTTVVLGKKILGKPKHEAEALKMLKSISGKSHFVLTSFCWVIHSNSKRKVLCAVEKTKVKIAKRSDDFWRWYVSTGEPMDKAGSYAAQGIGMTFIENIEGSYSNVVGLPLAQAMKELQKAVGKKIYQEIFHVA